MRGEFNSNFGAIAAAAGSAIGLGNIWRFPYIVGENGGAAFIFVYLIIVLLIGIPMLMTEFTLGRCTQKNVFGTFKTLSPNTKWYLVGVLGIATAFVILSFYVVIAGWTLAFLKDSIMSLFSSINGDIEQINFKQFAYNSYYPLIYLGVFTIITGFIVGKGIEKGIEKYNKILMPILFFIILVLCANAFTLDGFRQGMDFLFKADFSKVDSSVVLEALGQVFFSLSIGMGTMMTYGSYLKKKEGILNISVSVAFADVLIAILMGIAIFPAVFTYGIEPTSGPDLVYKTLPNIFAKMSGGVIFSIMFFILLFVAALTSAVSAMEVVIAYLTEELKWSRTMSVIVVTFTLFIMGSLCSLSLMENPPLFMKHIPLFKIFDTGSSSYMMPIGGLFIMLYAGWTFSKLIFRQELTSQGIFKAKYFCILIFLVKFVTPIAISLIFLSMIGLLKV